MNTPSVHIVRTGKIKLICVEDEWNDEGTAVVEFVDNRPTLVGLWRKENGGPECGDARLLSLEHTYVVRRLHGVSLEDLL